MKSGDLGASGGGGSRAPVFNVATGGSRLAATTGAEAGGIPSWVWYGVAGLAVWIWYRKGRH